MLLTLLLVLGIIAIVVGAVLAFTGRPWHGPVIGGVILLVLYAVLAYLHV